MPSAIRFSFLNLFCAVIACVLFCTTSLAQKSFTLADAIKSYADFNRHFYDSTRQLYTGTTKKEGVAAIWVQAIYWDVAMHVYERTKDKKQLQFIKDIYAGNYKQYDGYNWNNHKVWFIWDDMMWWVMAFARAHQITGDTMYLADAKRAADYTCDSMSKGGILPPEGDYNEQGILKSIFAHYLMELIDVYGQKQYLPWVEQNISLGWANCDKLRGITYRNYAVPCPTGDIQSYEASSIPMFMQLYFRRGAEVNFFKSPCRMRHCGTGFSGRRSRVDPKNFTFQYNSVLP